MNKPRYMEELLKIIFLWLGAAFVFSGLLCLLGILGPSKSSMVQSSAVLGSVYSLLGIAFFFAQTGLKRIAFSKSKLHDELLESGTKIDGKVEKVHLQKYTHYGKESPYRIFYTYTYKGKVYHHKSCLLWDKPDFAECDSVEVYADDFGKSTIRL